jgi:glycosyltransferase involved in cell wall biosynthesis
MFGPPLEMFHCGGTSITYDVTGHDEYIVDGFNGLVAEKDDDESVVSFINELKLNRSKLLMLKNNAIQTAENWLTWHQSTETFNQSLLEISEQFSESHFTKLKEHSNFMFDWYVVAENYKNALGDENAGLKQYLKSYVKFNWPKAFILLKKLKSAF